MTTGRIDYSPDYKSETGYTDAQITHSLVQWPTRTSVNPAVRAEHEQLKRRVLERARKWFAGGIAERAFRLDHDLNAALYDLLLFEGRHGLVEFESLQEKKG